MFLMLQVALLAQLLLVKLHGSETGFVVEADELLLLVGTQPAYLGFDLGVAGDLGHRDVGVLDHVM